MSIWFTIYKVTVSYQNMSSLSYHEIHLIRFIWSCCTFIYNKYVILSCFIINHHKTLLISQIPNQLLCYIFPHNILLHTSTSMTSRNLQSPTQSKHLKTGLYQRLADCCEVDRDSDLIYLNSVILRQYTTVTNWC